MIGVVASEADYPVVAEFFELFKTPWEFYRASAHYDVLICSNSDVPDNSAKLVLIYGNLPSTFDQKHGIETASLGPNTILASGADRIPIYGNCLAFKTGGVPVLLGQGAQEPGIVEFASEKQALLRIGLDLFHEIRYLLGCGQPAEHAGIPSLELHIELLRDLIVSRSIPLVEIPPVPIGYNFTACLTHDVDHAGIRNHKLDHTMFGFLYRATIGSLVNFFKGRRSLKEVAANWLAALSLPFIYLGVARDFWNRFDRYTDIEKEFASTFFIIPEKDEPGCNGEMAAPSRRAARYDIADVRDQIQRLTSAGREIGCHGIDAWHDAATGRQELQRIRRATGAADIGVRSHWLFFDQNSAVTLENAGFAYDSTIGYNETIGYRAGTSQVFKPLEATQLLELPMHVMDTALFYPDHMNLSPKQTGSVLNRFVENAIRFGGALTINWHDRSIAPERLWERPYVELLCNLKSSGAWFATAGEAVSWFKKRRSSRIDNVVRDGASVRVRLSMSETDRHLPGLRLRLHRSPSKHIDIPITSSTELELLSVH